MLLALVGEHLTLRLDELDPMIEILKPRWIVPMKLIDESRFDMAAASTPRMDRSGMLTAGE